MLPDFFGRAILRGISHQLIVACDLGYVDWGWGQERAPRKRAQGITDYRRPLGALGPALGISRTFEGINVLASTDCPRACSRAATTMSHPWIVQPQENNPMCSADHCGRATI